MYSAKNQRKVAGARTRWEPFLGRETASSGVREAAAVRGPMQATPHAQDAPRFGERTPARVAATTRSVSLEGENE
jgi:hypothetical protein